MLRSLQGQAGLMMGKNLKLDLVGGVCQELGGFCQCTVLHAGSVDGQDVISHMQGATSMERRNTQCDECSRLRNMTFTSFIVLTFHTVCIYLKKEKFECYRKHHLSNVKHLAYAQECRKYRKIQGNVFLLCLLKKSYHFRVVVPEVDGKSVGGKGRTGQFFPLTFFCDFSCRFVDL